MEKCSSTPPMSQKPPYKDLNTVTFLHPDLLGLPVGQIQPTARKHTGTQRMWALRMSLLLEGQGQKWKSREANGTNLPRLSETALDSSQKILAYEHPSIWIAFLFPALSPTLPPTLVPLHRDRCPCYAPMTP